MNHKVTLYEFYDPHPVLPGAGAPLPRAVLCAAHALNGVKTALEDGLQVIRQSCPDGDVTAVDSTVELRLGPHVWRVIKYRSANTDR